MSIMITVFAKLMSSTFAGMRTVSQSTELTTEAQLTTPMIITKLQQAACIFPPGKNISFGDTSLKMNSIGPTEMTTWRVGTDPIIAMFMHQSDNGLYDFYAYYPVKRSDYIAAKPIAPKADVQNDQSVWMLVEYRYPMSLSAKPLCDGSENLWSNSQPSFLTDFVSPNNDPNNDPYNMFEYKIPLDTDTDQRRSVTINLRFQRNNGNRIERLPADGSLLTTKIFPRNASYW